MEVVTGVAQQRRQLRQSRSEQYGELDFRGLSASLYV